MVIEYADVKFALASDQLVPAFQPLIDLPTGRLLGFEVLARWDHPQLGPILPVNFISLAEKHGLIKKLTEQVFRKAFQSSSILPAPLVLAVNVSPIQLGDLTLPRQIRKAAEKKGFPLERITVEITESALFDNLETAEKIVRELKSMGCKLALDDFGTGYSSLAHLQALAFDEIKIDRNFVMKMKETRQSRKIVAAVIGLGRSLGMTTVAEGIETEEQASMLLRLGCERGQGWLYGQPLAAESIPALVAAPPRRVLAGECIERKRDACSLEAFPAQRLAQLQAIYDGAPVGLCFLDCKLRYVSINQRLAKMNNINIDAHLGRTVQEMFPTAFPTYEPYLIRALRGEAIGGVEMIRPALHEGGSISKVLASYQPVWDEMEEVIGISIAVVDITEHMRTEEMHRKNLDAVYTVGQNPGIPLTIDQAGNHLLADSQWMKSPALHKKGAWDQGLMKDLHPDDMNPTIEQLKTAIRNGTHRY